MTIRIKFNVKAKLAAGFIVFFMISGTIPGIVSFLIDFFGLQNDPRFVIPLLTIAVSLILCVITSMYLRKWITAPIRKLIGATEEMVKGNLDVDPVVETGDEIESFSRSLARLESSLRIASDNLGLAEVDKYRDATQVRGLHIGDKILVGLIIFLILNPIVIAIPLFLSPDTNIVSPVISLLFSLILFVVLVSYLNRSIMQPFAALSDAAEKISRGDFSSKVRVNSKGDVGRLEQNFKNIYERVQRAMKELGMND